MIARINNQKSKNLFTPFPFLFSVFCLLSSLLICVPSIAMLDIFDHPKEIERKKRVTERESKTRLLDYPNECFLKGAYEETFNSCQKLLNYLPAQKLKGEILYLTGLSCLKMGRYIEARGYFNDIILIKNGKGDLKRDTYLGIGDSYFLEENYDKAFDTYNQILTQFPDSQILSIVYYRLGQTLSKMGRSEEAKHYLDKVCNEFPFSFEARLVNDIANKMDFSSCSVQTGCFNDKDNADALCEKLVKDGFDAYIYKEQGDDKPRFRVKVGRRLSKEEAKSLEEKLKRAGYSTKVCP